MTSPKYFRVDFTKGISKGDGQEEDFDPSLQPPSVSLRVSALIHHRKAYIGNEYSELSEFEELLDEIRDEIEGARAVARKRFAEEAHCREIEETKAKRRESKP